MRKNVKTFFSDFTNSLIPQPAFYKRLLRTPFSHSFFYFITLVFFLNSFFLLCMIVKVNPVRFIQLKNSMASQLKAHPANLIIHIKDGYIMSTSNRPYFFWIDHEGRKLLLGVVDEDAMPEKIYEYGSYFLLTNRVLVFNKNKLPPFPNSVSLAGINETVDREWALSVGNTLTQRYLFFSLLFLLVTIFIVPLYTLITNSIIIILASLGSFIVFKSFIKKHTLKKTIQLTLHAATLPLIILGFIGVLNPTVGNMWIPLFLLIVIFSISALYEAHIDHSDRQLHKTLRKRL